MAAEKDAAEVSLASLLFSIENSQNLEYCILQETKSKLSKFSHKSPTESPPKPAALEKPPVEKMAAPPVETKTSKSEKAVGEALMWVDKYKPQNLKQIIGQSGDKSNARKLMSWLQNWQRNVAAGKKPACESPLPCYKWPVDC